MLPPPLRPNVATRLIVEKHPLERRYHGKSVRDPYAWLKADNWQDVLRDGTVLPADIRAVIDAFNGECREAMADTLALQKMLLAEMRGRIKEEDDSVPAPYGAYAYFRRFREGGEHPLICRQHRDGSASTVLLDGDALAKDKDFFSLGAYQPSPDNRYLAWACDDTGSEYEVTRIRDMDSHADLADRIEDSEGAVVWAADSRSFFYVRLDENHRPNRVFHHRIGEPQSADRLVHVEEDPRWFVHLSQTQSGAFGLIEIADHETSQTYLIDLADPVALPRLVAAREENVRYEVEHHGEQLFILTNADGAVDSKLVTAPVSKPGRENWQELVPHQPGIYRMKHSCFAGHLVRLERENANPRIVIRDLRTQEEHDISFAEEAFALGYSPGYEFETTVFRFTYSSLTTPSETYDYDMVSRERVLRKRQDIPSGHDPAHYVTRRLYARAKDGEAIPISLVHRRDTPIDGSAPLMMVGYGSYGYSYPASFNSDALSLIDRGFVHAIAHVRGGTEKGWGWYLAGKREGKTHSFDDFIACAEHLASTGYGARGRIAAYGGSAGGLLMGGVANRAPEGLFGAIVADVPFVDALNTMLDDTLPLTPPEWPEWGNPIEDEQAFDLIASYSPYDNIVSKQYPAILALGGLSDPRVTYWEPLKWIARLRDSGKGGPFHCHIHVSAGHGGPSGRLKRLEEAAMIDAFVIATLQGQNNA